MCPPSPWTLPDVDMPWELPTTWHRISTRSVPKPAAGGAGLVTLLVTARSSQRSVPEMRGNQLLGNHLMVIPGPWARWKRWEGQELGWPVTGCDEGVPSLDTARRRTSGLDAKRCDNTNWCLSSRRRTSLLETRSPGMVADWHTLSLGRHVCWLFPVRKGLVGAPRLLGVKCDATGGVCGAIS